MSCSLCTARERESWQVTLLTRWMTWQLWFAEQRQRIATRNHGTSALLALLLFYAVVRAEQREA